MRLLREVDLRVSTSAKENFCRSFEWHIDIKWMDLTGFVRIDEYRRAKVMLARTTLSADNYDAFKVSIINKHDGVVDVKVFRFDDYLDTSLDGRSDNRTDYPLGRNDCFHVTSYIGWRWYIAVPKTTRPLCKEIENYIEIFQ